MDAAEPPVAPTLAEPSPSTSSEASGSPPTAGKRRRLLPRFGLRFLFVFAVLFCLFFAWVARNVVRMREEEAAIEKLLQANATIVIWTGEGIDEETVSASSPDPSGRTLGERTFGERLGRAIGWSGPRRITRVLLGSDDPQDTRILPALAGLRLYPILWQVELHGRAFDDRAMRELAKAESMRSLTLDRTSVTGEGLASLAPHVRLSSIQVVNMPDRGLIEGIAAHQELSGLSLWGLPVEREDVETIATLPNLQHLTLTAIPLYGQPHLLSPLGQAPSLAALSVYANGVDEGAVVELPPLPRLERFDFEGYSLAELPAAPNLEFLDAEGVTDDMLTRWEAPAGLRSVVLHSPVTEKAARKFWIEHPDCVVTYWEKPGVGASWPGAQVLK